MRLMNFNDEIRNMKEVDPGVIHRKREASDRTAVLRIAQWDLMIERDLKNKLIETILFRFRPVLLICLSPAFTDPLLQVLLIPAHCHVSQLLSELCAVFSITML